MKAGKVSRHCCRVILRRRSRACLRFSVPNFLTVSSQSAAAPGTVTHSALSAGSSCPWMPCARTACPLPHITISVGSLFLSHAASCPLPHTSITVGQVFTNHMLCPARRQGASADKLHVRAGTYPAHGWTCQIQAIPNHPWARCSLFVSPHTSQANACWACKLWKADLRTSWKYPGGESAMFLKPWI